MIEMLKARGFDVFDRLVCPWQSQLLRRHRLARLRAPLLDLQSARYSMCYRKSYKKPTVRHVHLEGLAQNIQNKGRTSLCCTEGARTRTQKRQALPARWQVMCGSEIMAAAAGFWVLVCAYPMPILEPDNKITSRKMHDSYCISFYQWEKHWIYCRKHLVLNFIFCNFVAPDVSQRVV